MTLLAVMLLAACSSNAPAPEINVSPADRKAPLHGQVNQILVISDSSLWAGPVGDTFFYYFNAPYILLPRPEPIFDLIHRTPQQLEGQPSDKSFRNIIFLADLNDENSPTIGMVRNDISKDKLTEIQQEKQYNVTVGEDKWALNQQLFYINGFGEDKLTECIAANFPAIARNITEQDNEIINGTIYKEGEDTELEAEVLTKFKLSMKIPKGFKIMKYDSSSNTLWLRNNEENNANILLHKLSYKDESQFTKAGLQKIRDAICGITASEYANANMRINDTDLPFFVESITMNSVNAIQAKGIWGNMKASEGGPFVSYLLLNPKTNELVLVDGFLFNEGKKMRDNMQELEQVLATAIF